MSRPFVSVIVPVFNEEKYLTGCLESVLGQALDKIEIIVVNDCSTDNSPEIIHRYLKKDSRIRLINHDRNKGLGEARNTGIDNSSGKYVYFLDSDDSLPTDSLDTLYSVANEFGSGQVLGGFNSKVDVDSTFIKYDLYNISISSYPDLLYNHSALNKLISREKLSELGIRFVPPRYAEDILFSLKLNLAVDSTSIVRNKTYNYRWGRQIKSATRKKVFDAQRNVITALELVKNCENKFLFSKMQEKTAKTVFSSMIRAVYALDSSEIQTYLQNWNKALPVNSDSFYKKLPKYVSLFCSLIAEENYEAANKYWRRIHYLKSIHRIFKFPAAIRRLF